MNIPYIVSFSKAVFGFADRRDRRQSIALSMKEFLEKLRRLLAKI